MYGCVSEWVGSVCVSVVCVCPLCDLFQDDQNCWMISWARGSHVSSLGSGKPRHPMRNSRLLFLVRRLSFTTSTKYYDLSLLDSSNMFTLVCITVDFAPVELSPTHCPHADLDVSLKDFPPTSSETVLPRLPLSPSAVFVSSLLFTIFAGGLKQIWKKTTK
jgi:hypothetical protein